MNTLKQACKIIGGKSPASLYLNTTGQGVAFAQGSKSFTDAKYMEHPQVWTTKPIIFAEKGDILISLRAPVARVNMTKGRVCIGRGLAIIRPDKEKFVPEFLYYWLLAHKEQIKQYSNGTTFAQITLEHVKNIPLIFPPWID